jgi:hypothetical protein
MSTLSSLEMTLTYKILTPFKKSSSPSSPSFKEQSGTDSRSVSSKYSLRMMLTDTMQWKSSWWMKNSPLLALC